MRGPKPKIPAAAVCAVLMVFAVLFLTKANHKQHVARQAKATEPPFHFAQPAPNRTVVTNGATNANVNGLFWFSSNIPILILRSESPGPISKSKTYTRFNMEIYEPKDNNLARFGTAPSVQAKVGLRLHGMVSRLFPKLSYRLKVQDENGGKNASPLLGMPADPDWVLQGPWLDKSLIRNAFSYDLARTMGCAAMRTRPCEVFISTSGKPVTESDYVGVYQLIEHIERTPDRVNITKLSQDENAEPAITGGYILSWDVGAGRYLPSWKTIQLKYPSHPSPAQLRWIDEAFTRFNEALKSKDFRDPAKGYAAHIEVDDWVNYILFEELIFNLDGYVRSFYFQKERNGKIRPGPVWDHDLALGHQFQNGTSFHQWWYMVAGSHRWIIRLTKDPAFTKKMAQRWWSLRSDVLRNESIDALIDAHAAPLLSGAADRNFERWKVLDSERPFPKPNDYITIATATYPEQIRALKQFLHDRAAWMDAHLPKFKVD